MEFLLVRGGRDGCCLGYPLILGVLILSLSRTDKLAHDPRERCICALPRLFIPCVSSHQECSKVLKPVVNFLPRFFPYSSVWLECRLRWKV